ncbi:MULTISPECIES: DUF6479 family protein [unclassified Streptomyces]|uniref:DUF6479 family protein n=1 Tax=unclassified Streptomyces TaxID=2593676 RepID=UPI00362C0A3B
MSNMHTHGSTVLAVEGGSSLLFLIVGIIVVLGLLAMFVSGRRRAARRTEPSTPAPGTAPGSEEAQHGTTWQTRDDDPEQGHPHR